jgi:tRNA(adenine34) deaminase
MAADEDDERWMGWAIDEALAAMTAGEVPVGCVIVDTDSDKIVARAHNRRITDGDPTAHAEIVALRQAAATAGDWRLDRYTLYVTLEPCPMCAGAAVNARLLRLVWGCADPKAGAVRSLYQICDDPRLNHRLQLRGGVLSEQCSSLLTDFFRSQRALGKK